MKDIYYDHEIESVEPSSECVNGFTLSANNSVQLFTHPEATKIIEVFLISSLFALVSNLSRVYALNLPRFVFEDVIPFLVRCHVPV